MTDEELNDLYRLLAKFASTNGWQHPMVDEWIDKLRALVLAEAEYRKAMR